MFGGQETEHVKDAPSEITGTSERVTVGCDHMRIQCYSTRVRFRPVVNLCSGRSVRVDGRFVGLVRFVKAEAVVATVSRAVELLKQEDHGLVDNSQHSQAVHPCHQQRDAVTIWYFFVLGCV